MLGGVLRRANFLHVCDHVAIARRTDLSDTLSGNMQRATLCRESEMKVAIAASKRDLKTNLSWLKLVSYL